MAANLANGSKKRFDFANLFGYNREGQGSRRLEKETGQLTYAPLWRSLVERQITRSQMAKSVGMSKSTLAKMGHDEYVSLEVICRICSFLGCRVEEVMEIKNA